VAEDPPTLMLPALFADTCRHLRGVGAVLEIVAAGSYQGCLQRSRPLFVDHGEPPYLIWREAEIAEYRPEWLAAIDCREELLPNLDRHACSRSRPFADTGIVTMRRSAGGATATLIPR